MIDLHDSSLSVSNMIQYLVLLTAGNNIYSFYSSNSIKHSKTPCNIVGSELDTLLHIQITVGSFIFGSFSFIFMNVNYHVLLHNAMLH